MKNTDKLFELSKVDAALIISEKKQTLLYGFCLNVWLSCIDA